MTAGNIQFIRMRNLDLHYVIRFNFLVKVYVLSSLEQKKGGKILYDPGWEVVLEAVFKQGWAAAFFLNPPEFEHMKEISQAGLKMPQKSTYFYPKVLTGLVFNKIDPNEIIQIP